MGSRALRVEPARADHGAVSEADCEREPKPSRRVVFLYVMWAFAWYEPDWFVASLGAGPVLVKVYAALFLPVCAMLVTQARRESGLWPFLLILAVHLVWLPFVANRGLLINQLGKYFQYCALALLTVFVLQTPRQVVTLAKLFLFQFLWFGAQGLSGGRVKWHYVMGDENSYGALMSIGVGYSYYLVMGFKDKRSRIWAAMICTLCVAGAVLSMARGVMIALAIIFTVIALRTPRKLFFLGFGTLILVLGLVVIQLAFPDGQFWDEMASISEGTEDGTGLQRWVLWKTAWLLFTTSPIIGVGPGNFGWNAAEYYLGIGASDLGSTFDDPAKMYMWVVHNDYLGILSEQGIVGVIGFVAVLFYFQRALMFLRSEAGRQAWQEHGESQIDSRMIAYALEAAMIGFLVNSFFYCHFYVSWMWSIVTLALVTASVARLPIGEGVPLVSEWSGGRSVKNRRGSPPGGREAAVRRSFFDEREST